MSGSHATEDGRSGLTDKDQIEYGFYREDCEAKNGVPDITKQAEKVQNQDSLL